MTAECRDAGRGRRRLLPRRRCSLLPAPVSRRALTEHHICSKSGLRDDRLPARPTAPPPQPARARARLTTTTQRSMLQRTSLYIQVDGTANQLIEGCAPGEVSSEEDSDAIEDIELPQCKIKRNYNCTKCAFYTQSPRDSLIHARNAHKEKIKIFECSHCLYASRHHQKLLRHKKMMHTILNKDSSNSRSVEPMPVPPFELEEPSYDPEDDIMYEDIEDDIAEIEVDDEETLENNAELEGGSSQPGQNEQGHSKTKKNNNFSCMKCNYVTHIRSRYTKHVKYHSMPMIKCTLCDFRTPYKWNLDRHMRNHGGPGNFKCSMCNFTADIKQSLTVHEMNHHTPAVGMTSSVRRRNRVGASDSAVIALIVKEVDVDAGGLPLSESPDMGAPDADIELVSCTSESNDGVTSSKMDESSNDASCDRSLNGQDDKKQNRKPARPIPQLIPLNTSTPTQNKVASNGEPPVKKSKEDANETKSPFKNLPADISLIPVVQNTVAKEPNRKKNNSFFDKLKERLLTETGEKGTLTCKDCGFESKCLSEHSVHEKNCNSQGNKVQASSNVSSLGSSRCQYCRHRCKSSADLHQHLQTCNKKTSEEAIIPKSEKPNSDVQTKSDKESEPHPMENVVFVWNDINQEENKFNTPLGININDDATLPEPAYIHILDPENGDENDGMILSPTQAVGKKVFKCPQCPFWASTASRFHVHIVGHLNKKPFECSLCKYKSNWRWDITKHIKLKSVRDPEHNVAKVLMTDETGRRNYSKYNKFLAVSITNEGGENELVYVDPDAAATDSVDMEESNEGQPLNLQTHNDPERAEKPKKTMWKCKRCNYKDQSKEALLEHVKEHSKMPEDPNDPKKLENRDPNELAYRCGHCNQLSNWKHVIQRHCRLKHEGVIKVIPVERPKMDPNQIYLSDIQGDYCTKCPYKSSDKAELVAHVQQHTPSPLSIFKCYFCPFFVKNEDELLQHLQLHGISDPQELVSKTMGSKSPVSEPAVPTKRHKCLECPYETNSKSQFMYHEQFHRLPDDTPYKCHECNYSVSKRHLLHQHLRVHGIVPKLPQKDTEVENEASTSINTDVEIKEEIQYEGIEDIPYVWVSAKNEFHKMYKCRYCSYVISHKNKIPIHEKVHLLSFDDSEAAPVYKCLECKFTCYHASKLSEHSKGHGEMYGRIYCAVQPEVSDEEQIQKLRKIIEEEKNAMMDGLLKEEASPKDVDDDRMLYFCQKCPTRFFSETDLKVHLRFHEASFPNKCNICEFSVPMENQLKAHFIVHTYDYQSKTKLLKAVHETHPDHKEPKLDQHASTIMSEVPWAVTGTVKKENSRSKPRAKRPEGTKAVARFLCGECPAKFFKGSARNYHRSLHGSDGEHKCKTCSYAVKNIGNLAKHEFLHQNEGKTTTAVDYESADDVGDDVDYKNIPLSGTDLFHRKTEAQKRVLNDKTKLVKPNDHFPPVLHADPQFGYLMHGNPEFIYPTYLKNGRQKEKRYKCHKCPSAFEKREQYKIHLSLHGSKQRYKCELCDYSVKYYANYVQHMRKHEMNDQAQAERKGSEGYVENAVPDDSQEDSQPDIKLAIKTMPKSAPRSDFQQFSVCDQQILRLLQRRRSINGANEACTSETAPVKDRKLHLCTLCPYSNQRQDALHNHYRRHDKEDLINAGYNKCPHCDLVVVQSNFLRDHIKTHFNHNKNATPNCFTANNSVTFTITKIEENGQEDETTKSELKLITESKHVNNMGSKIFVKISSGETFME